MSRGYNKSRPFSVTASRDGGRSFYQHDDRQGGGRMPEGHWRGGGPPRGGGGSRGEPSRGGRGRGFYNDNYHGGNDYYRGQSSAGKFRSSRRRGSRGSFSRGSYGPRNSAPRGHDRGYGGGGAAPHPRSEDEDVVMKEDGRNPPPERHRHNPYGSSKRQRHGRASSKNQKRNAHYSWVEVKIPHGKKVEKEWLIKAIQEECSIPFVPVDFHYSGESAIFYVDDLALGAPLSEASRKIIAPSGYKVLILTRNCDPPAGATLNAERLEILKTAMSNRYDPVTKSLNLSDIYNDKDLQGKNMYVELHKNYYMQAVIKIISENIPEIQSLIVSKCFLYTLSSFESLPEKIPNLKVIDLTKNTLKHMKDLQVLKGLKLEELKLDGNSLCNYYKDKTDYVSDIRQMFPTVLRLDGVELPPPIAFELDESTALPPVKGSFFVNEEVKAIVVPFVEKFFTVFDSGNRQVLVDAYHEQATFSLSVPNNSSRSNKTNLGNFAKYSRNLFKVKDSGQRFKLLKQGNVTVTAFLKDLPGTQHDMRSFIVDVSLAQGTLLLFTVDGVFKEIDSRNNNPQIIAFSRSFFTHFDNRLLILNDELCLKYPTEKQIKAAFPSAAPTPSHSPVLESSSGPSDHEKMSIVSQFSKDSGMNLKYSKMCLEQNEWDYQKAAKMFSEMKAQGSITKEMMMM
ncbi:nuclear RNA export factor 1-like [Anneissia japonica]|uniref:nuclear RNA export factor 1-like n=1 Tax=Anneissia japonica TaxID=1529436 RepID=UPI001425913E|nr:nuclear RNA export factor 1-like [Anneissia japonica]